jgi:hypothetical protein
MPKINRFIFYDMKTLIKTLKRMCHAALRHCQTRPMCSLSTAEIKGLVVSYMLLARITPIPVECQVMVNQCAKLLETLIRLIDADEITQCHPIVKALKIHCKVMKKRSSTSSKWNILQMSTIMRKIPNVQQHIICLPDSSTSQFFPSCTTASPMLLLEDISKRYVLMTQSHVLMHSLDASDLDSIFEDIVYWIGNVTQGSGALPDNSMKTIHAYLTTVFTPPFEKITFNNFSDIMITFYCLQLLLEKLTHCQNNAALFLPWSNFCQFLILNLKTLLFTNSQNAFIKDCVTDFTAQLSAIDWEIDQHLKGVPCTLTQLVEDYKEDILNPLIYGKWWYLAKSDMNRWLNALHQPTESANTFMKK